MPRFRPARFAFLSSLLVCLAAPSLAQSLKITSTPAGAKVELDGVAAGTTPFEKTFPGGYFHRAHTVIGQRLEHPMVARVSLAGYATHEIALTEGPCSGSIFTAAITGNTGYSSPTISRCSSIRSVPHSPARLPLL